MIIPCIDLMGGKVVQLVQGREKALEAESPDAMVEKFTGFDQIQVIDLDAAMGTGWNGEIVEYLAGRAMIRAGGGIRAVERACQLIKCGAYRVIVGTAAFTPDGLNTEFLKSLNAAIGREKTIVALDSKNGRVVVNGWKQVIPWTAEQVIEQLEPYCSGFLCTYVDKEGMMQGTDLDWFGRLRRATNLELTAAGGITSLEDIEALTAMGIHCAIGMSIYTGRLNLEQLRAANKSTV